MMPSIDRDPLIDELLDEWAPALGASRSAYGGHAHRVYNLTRAFLGSDRQAALAVASAFHDLGIWSDRTFDYLEPSAARAQAHLRERAPMLSAALVDRLIRQHHRLLPVRSGPFAQSVEAFRKADLVDLTRGWFAGGLDRGFLRELVAAFPFAGFHGLLLRTAAAWSLKHPLRPLPMVKLLPDADEREPGSPVR